MSTTTTTADKPRRRFPPPCWTQDETLALIQAYRERWYALRRSCLRSADWDAVAEHVSQLYPAAVPPKTSAQCRHKMEKLRQRYRAEKQRAGSFSGGRFLSTWLYYEAMDSMESNGNDPIVNSRIKHQSVTNLDSDYVSKRSNRFKPVSAAREEDNIEFDDLCYVETLIDNNSGARVRKFSKTGSDSCSYRNENRGGKMSKCRKKEKVKKENDSIGDIVLSVKALADGFVKMEKMKMDVVHEIEMMRIKAEMKREELLLESHKRIIEAFVKGLSES
ncbi:uncharacterized protein LOC143543190 [Bidens hawaiensis]|uniref:uncharacterized protein LOC143543190 n=1 Tax=Bidens hawaiensis TaxID=980011 RepID=UPI0040499B22